MAKPSAGTLTDEELQKEYDAYCLALGRFTDAFSQVELVLHFTLSSYANVNRKTAQAVFSGVRIDNAMGLIKRLAIASKLHWRKRKDLDYVFDQLGIINKARNDIVHYGGQWQGPERGRIVSNRFVALTTDHLRERPISAEALDHMCHDLMKINLHLSLHALPLSIAKRARYQNPFRPVLKSAWQYIPPQQPQRRRKTRKRPQKQSRQHQSSRG